MLWLVAILGQLHAGLTAFDDKNSQWRKNRESQLPEALRIDEREKSGAGRDYTEIRLPYGPNPNFVRTVADVTMIDSDRYRESYQENIRNVQILTEDFRLDDQFFTNKNNYSNYHLPEAQISKMQEFWNLRRRRYE